MNALARTASAAVPRYVDVVLLVHDVSQQAQGLCML
jgi:hypothetical protein